MQGSANADEGRKYLTFPYVPLTDLDGRPWFQVDERFAGEGRADEQMDRQMVHTKNAYRKIY